VGLAVVKSPHTDNNCSYKPHVQASSFALAVVFFFLPVMKIEVLTNSVSDTYL